MSRVLDVAWVPAELPAPLAAGGPAVVIDVVRATTSITTALAAGARRVIAVATVAEARARAAALEGALLCGEREGLPPVGFDLGNSPGSYTAERVSGRTLVFTTTNGTRAMTAAAGADPLMLACFRNLETVAGRLARDLDRSPKGDGAVLVCAGRRGRVSMDDAWCAGHLVDRVARIRPDLSLTDGACAARELAGALGAPTARALARTSAGRAGVALELGGDLEDCARLDDLDVVPLWRAGAFVTGGEEESDGG